MTQRFQTMLANNPRQLHEYWIIAFLIKTRDAANIKAETSITVDIEMIKCSIKVSPI